MSAPSTFISIDGARITGDPEKIKEFVAFYVRSKIQCGSDTIMNACSPDLAQWALNLREEVGSVWAWSAESLAEINK